MTRQTYDTRRLLPFSPIRLTAEPGLPGASRARRGAFRGISFEPRTDTSGVARGAEGVLVSTSACPAGGAGAASTQINAAEAVAALEAAQSLDDAAGCDHVATCVKEQEAVQAHKDFLALPDPADKAKFADAVSDQKSLKSKPGMRGSASSPPVEKFGHPLGCWTRRRAIELDHAVGPAHTRALR